LSDRNPLKFDAVTNLQTWVAFTHMTYMIDFNTKNLQTDINE
jgi:hypothetical protein